MGAYNTQQKDHHSENATSPEWEETFTEYDVEEIVTKDVLSKKR